jgi:lipopolysaccharide transport protein LptA
VAVAFGPHWLKARRMSLWLTDDDRGLQFARALSEVRGRLRIGDGEASGAGEGGAARFEGRTATAVFEPQSRELRRFELEGRPTRPATLWSVSPDEPPRILTAGYITGDLAGGLLSRVSALGGVRLAEVSEAPPEEPWEDPAEAGAEVLVESSGESDEAAEGEGEGEGEGEAGDSLEGAALDAAPAANRDGLVVSTELPAELPPGTLRIVTGVRGEAVFGAEGRLTELSLLDGFALLAPEIRGRGERARLDLASGVGEFLGEPVEVSTADGDLAAPRLLYTQRSGLLYAEGGARTRLAEAASAGALAGSPLGQGEGPVWVESQEAFLRDRPRSFLFRGKVRAWRGEALLLADELQGNGDEGRLAASGHVRSLWPGERAEGDESAPVEVTAGTLAYARGEGRLVYRQDVVAVQGSRSLAAQELTVELGEGGRAEVLIARGAVRIEDRTSGKTVQGDRARYVVSGSEVEVEGEKVVMRDKAGAEVSGRRVVYRFDTGVVEVQGAAGPAGPAGER